MPLIGTFNVYNSLAALAAAHAMGVDLRPAVTALAKAEPVPGRLQAIPSAKNFRIFVDYAHSEDALINVMKTLRELRPARLIVVFGCGGNRDKTKRPRMAAAVDQYADVAVVTSDNPRDEEPSAIIAEMRPGFHHIAPIVIEDRRDAIIHAVGLAQPRDIVLIAGKGHENYQEIRGQKFPFDDVSIARGAITSRADVIARQEPPAPPAPRRPMPPRPPEQRSFRDEPPRHRDYDAPDVIDFTEPPEGGPR
jgi:UDP-N-acetylmuramoyl-L-alanyl-D-glutamate--2,6-diaminopimelate ligase